MNNDISWLKERLLGAGAPVIIDGGMGTELEKAGVPMDGKVWSGRAVLSHPDTVRRIHEEFITAGAEVIIANTFAAARHMLEPGGLGEHVTEINLNAVKLAQQARDNVAQKSATREPVAIVGSICEWSSSENPEWHTPEAVSRSAREQADLLAGAGVDMIALEMCEQSAFSVAATEAALATGLPVWIGMSAQTHKGCETLSVFDHADLDFEPLVKSLADYPAMMLNIMHTPVPDIEQSLGIVRKHWDGPVGIYPESGFFTMPNWNFVDVIEPDELATAAQDWVKNGVRMVGGCCGLGPDHIAALRQALG